MNWFGPKGDRFQDHLLCIGIGLAGAGGRRWSVERAVAEWKRSWEDAAR